MGISSRAMWNYQRVAVSYPDIAVACALLPSHRLRFRRATGDSTPRHVAQNLGVRESYGPVALQTQNAPTIASQLVEWFQVWRRGGNKLIQFHSCFLIARQNCLKFAKFHGKSLKGTGARAFLVEAPRPRNGWK